MNVSLGEQCTFIAKNTVNINDGALFVQNGRTQNFEIIQSPDAFVIFAQMCELYHVIIRVSIEIFFIECGECFAGNQMLKYEFL